MDLTLAEIAKELDTPETTIRYRAKLFTEFFSYVQEGRKKLYRREDIEVFKAIAEFLQNGLDRKQIQEELRKRFPSNAEVSEVGGVPSTTTTTTTTTTALPAILNGFAELLRQQQEINQKLTDIVEQLEKRKSFWEVLFDRILGKGGKR